MKIGSYRFGSLVLAALLTIFGAVVSAEEGGGGEPIPAQRPADSVFDYQPPVFQGDMIGLIDAVRITLENQPNIRLQAQDEMFKAGLLQEATGQFDLGLSGGLSYEYSQQELSGQQKNAEASKRSDIADAISDALAGIDTAQARVDDYIAAVDIFNSGGDLDTIAFSNPTDQAAWDVLLATLENAPPESQGDVRSTIGDWLTARRDVGTESIASEQARVDEGFRELERLGEVPDAEEDITGSFDLTLTKQYRSGPTISPYITLDTYLSNYKGKEVPVDRGGMGMIQDWQSKIGFRIDIPLGRGRGVESTGAREKAADIDYQASLDTTTHTASFEVLQTVQAYWTMLAAQKTVDVLERSQALNDRILELSKAMVDADELPRAELARILARGADARAQVENARRSLEQARLALVTTVGLQVGGASQAPLASDDFPPLPDARALDGVDAGALTLYAFDHRYDYQAARLLEESGRVLFQAATIDLSPITDLGVEMSYSGRETASNTLDGIKGAFGGKFAGPSAKVDFNVDWPIKNNVQRGRLEQQRSLYNQSAITTRDLARKIQSNIVIEAETLKEAARSVQYYQESVDFYRDTVKTEVEKFRIGMSTLIDTIFTEQNQIFAELGLISSLQQYATLLARLRFETAMLIGAQEDGWVVAEDNLLALPVVAAQ